jgi:hypothetical protein
MGDLRFILATVAVFVATFAGISFGMPRAFKNFSVAAVSNPPAKLETLAQPLEQTKIAETPPEPAAPQPAPARETIAAPLPPPKTAAPPVVAAAPADPGDRLAQTALQAAQAYARTPCDRMAKTMFIVAASTYLRAQDRSSRAPKDARVHDAIKTAFQTGQVRTEEFPPDLMISGRFAPAPPSRTSCVNSAGLRP